MKSDKDIQKKSVQKVTADTPAGSNGFTKGLYQKAQVTNNNNEPASIAEKVTPTKIVTQNKKDDVYTTPADNVVQSATANKAANNSSDELQLPATRVVSDEKKNAANFDFDDEVFDTVLEENITFTGTIKFTKPFMIKGVVRGNIIATSDLVIDTNARVAANIKAQRVLIRGAVRGNVIANSLVRVFTTGELVGDISAGNVVLDPGSNFCGKCTMIK